MTTAASSIGAGRFAVPGNRWDLVTGLGDLMTRAAEISVVVPFYDNQHDLDLLLAALSVQTHPLGRLQVVIADDGSPEPPRVPELAQGLNISIFHQEDAGFRAGAARNLGVARSDGDVLLFLDGDTVPRPDYVEKMGRLPAVLPDAVVSGRRRYADLSGWTPTDLLTWFAGRTPGPDQWDEPAWMTQEYQRTQNLLSVHPRSYKYLIGAVMGCSRAMFDTIGGFDESIVGYGGEDYDLTYRAYNCGAVLAYVHEAVAWHDGREWAGRTAPADQAEQKNREVMMLAERIPEPSMRGHGQVYSVPDVRVSVHTDGWSLSAGVLCIRSMLTNLDCAITVVGQKESTQDVREAFKDDPRVVAPFPLGRTDPLTATRSRLHLAVHEAVTAGPEFADRISRMLEEDTGTLVVTAEGRTVVLAESNRRRQRNARYAGGAAGEDPWFDLTEVEHHAAGLALVPTEPRLAAIFGGY